MRLCHLTVDNYARMPRLELEVRRHLVLVGANDVGKTSILNCINLLLGATVQQIYQGLGVIDIADVALPLILRGRLCDFTPDERALFVDDITIVQGQPETLAIELEVRVSDDDPDSVVVRRHFPETSGRAPSREQLEILGWHFLPAARGAAADYIDGKRSPLRTLLTAADLGPGGDELRDSLEGFNERLDDNVALTDLRQRIAGHLSQSMPKDIGVEDLSLRTTANPAEDVLEDVTLFLKKDGEHSPLKSQSDGVRQLMTMSFFDLAKDAANIVAVDEPELHLHASSQRTVADLFAHGATQRLIVTHSPYILQRFEPAHVAVVLADRSVRQIQAKSFSAVQKEMANWWSPHLLEALTARRILLVEGVADRIIVEAAARVRGLNVDRLGISILDIGGAEKFKHVNKLLGADGFGLDLMGLVDKAESGSWVNGLKVKPRKVNIERVFVCATDLEAEYVNAMTGPVAAAALVAEGFKERSILQSVGANAVADIAEEPLADYLRKNKVTGAVAIASQLTEAHVAGMPAIAGLINYIERT